MTPASTSRLDHLRRLTDPRGLIHAARGDCPDRFGGFTAIDNADALRLCALASSTIRADAFHPLAKTYFDCLVRGKGEDGRVHHICDSRGQWTETDDDAWVQSCLARALASVIVSELPIVMRLAAANWWKELLPHADSARTPQSAGNWLIALGQLRAADPGKDLARAERLARWLVEDCYYPIRSTDWEWFETQWIPGSSCVVTGLWYAHRMLDEQRYATVADAATQFLIEHLFQDGLFLPVGTCGGWSQNQSKASFDQLPSEVAGMVELLCTAEHVSGSRLFGQYADFATRWFDGINLRGATMVDNMTGGCRDALTADGPSADQGGSAIVSYLLTRATITTRAKLVEEPTVHTTAIAG